MVRSSVKKKVSKNTDDQGGGEHEIIIKKYANRRLYNTATSSYIVLSDIVELIKADTAFRIEDAKTGEDITRSILNQVIFEQESEGSAHHFPLEFQKRLISMYGDNYGSMIPDYLSQSLKLFVDERNKMSEAFEDMLGKNTKTMLDYSQALAKQNLELFKSSWNMFSAITGTETVDQEKKPDNRDTELDEIQSKIDALQERLKSLE